MDLTDRLAIARGERPADTLLTNLQLVNVFTGEVYRSEIAIAGTHIAGVGEGYAAQQTLDLGGRYVAPGLIDAHVHIESSMCTPPEFARAVLTHGVTTVVTDPHEIANVHGLEGVRFMLNAAKYGPLSIYVMASSCVPATHMETAGAALDAADLQILLGSRWVLGLAEVMNYPAVVSGQADVLTKLAAFEGRVLDGHCPGLRGADLNAYIVAGIQSDHECTTVEEAREKLRKGMVVFIRQATNAQNLRPLLPLITPENSRRLCWCTDDRQPADLLDEGSIDHMIRVAIAEGGIDPVTAIRMGTLNPAEYFRLHDLGAIAPGRRADLFVFSDLAAPRAETVFRGGQIVAQGGKLLASLPTPDAHQLPPCVNIDWQNVDFRIPARGRRLRVIGSIPNQLVTEHRVLDARLEDGCAVADPARDLLKMAVIERHLASGSLGKGFIQGIGLKRGAIAGTVAHDHHNLVVIGADDASMMTAVRAVERMGGGLVAVEGERVLAELPLPVAGLMSTAPIGDVRARLDGVLAAARDGLGSPLHDPFMAMAFMALEVIPSLKLTDAGLVDVDRFEVVDLFVD
ncbi:MAG TPA: adenine deaminase [Aggregatilineaceae bacterium]|jgi:adenine deaminase|nr:adenine deaminase [Aggregatilineaceae bacterium]